MNMDEFKSSIAKLLRDVPRGITADLSDSVTAHWAGSEVVYCRLCEDGSGGVGEEFDLNEKMWVQLQSVIDSWIKRPVFSMRPEMRT
ncbi:hypothetical protein [Paraburkholderia sp. 2C]